MEISADDEEMTRRGAETDRREDEEDEKAYHRSSEVRRGMKTHDTGRAAI